MTYDTKGRRIIGPQSTWEGECKALRAENERLRKALGFYADVGDYVAPYTGAMGKLWQDCGETARAALQQPPQRDNERG